MEKIGKSAKKLLIPLPDFGLKGPHFLFLFYEGSRHHFLRFLYIFLRFRRGSRPSVGSQVVGSRRYLDQAVAARVFGLIEGSVRRLNEILGYRHRRQKRSDPS